MPIFCLENSMDRVAWWAKSTWRYQILKIKSIQFSCSAVSNSLWPYESSTPGLPVHNQLPEFTQTLVHESVMPPNHLIFLCPLLLLPSIFPSIRVLQMSQLFATSVLPMNTQDWSSLGWTGWISLKSKGLSRVFSNTTVQKHQFFGAQLSSPSNSHIHTWPREKT